MTSCCSSGQYPAEDDIRLYSVGTTKQDPESQMTEEPSAEKPGVTRVLRRLHAEHIQLKNEGQEELKQRSKEE